MVTCYEVGPDLLKILELGATACLPSASFTAGRRFELNPWLSRPANVCLSIDVFMN